MRPNEEDSSGSEVINGTEGVEYTAIPQKRKKKKSTGNISKNRDSKEKFKIIKKNT